MSIGSRKMLAQEAFRFLKVNHELRVVSDGKEARVIRAYGRGVTSFISKPLEFKLFLAAVQELEHLLKFAVAIKSVRRRTRVANRQIFRLLRRQQQLERLMDRHMEQFESILTPPAAEQSSEKSEPTLEETLSREPMLRPAHKTLERMPAKGARAASPAGAEPVRAQEALDASILHHTPDLLRLARALSSTAEDPSQRPPSASPRGGIRQPQ